jgi:hypothetical protein
MFLLFELFLLLFAEKQIICVICIYLRKLVSNTILYQMMFVSFNSNTKDATCGAESACL